MVKAATDWGMHASTVATDGISVYMYTFFSHKSCILYPTRSRISTLVASTEDFTQLYRRVRMVRKETSQ